MLRYDRAMQLSRRPERVVVLALDGVYAFELGIPSRILGAADGRYEVLTCTADGRPVRTDAGFTVTADHGPRGAGHRRHGGRRRGRPVPRVTAEPPAEVRAALALVRPTARLVSICTGAFVLAAAGLLDGHRATTHWQLADAFRRMFPRVRLDPDVLFVDDGRVLTSAGAASGIDVCLHLVREDHGSDLANAVARRCVVPPFREGGQVEADVDAGGGAGRGRRPSSSTKRTSGSSRTRGRPRRRRRAASGWSPR
ncbi:Transcriptional regulator OS=Streptomyces fumanus OX=67302 GN=GCM10018772_25970 PE=4 SV=1 [Streptomyces fumanus]